MTIGTRACLTAVVTFSASCRCSEGEPATVSTGVPGPAATTAPATSVDGTSRETAEVAPGAASDVANQLPGGRGGEPPPRDNEYTDVWSAGPSAAFVVGLTGTIVQWNGRRWTSPLPSSWIGESVSDLHAVWGNRADDVWVVGGVYPDGVGTEGEALAGHFDGRRWSRKPVDVPGPLYAVWGTGSRDVWAVGQAGKVVRWDGRRFTIVPSPTTGPLVSIWGFGPRDVWVTGAGGVALHWNGSEWSETRTPGSSYGGTVRSRQLWGTGSGDLWAHSFSVERWNGRGWVEGSGPERFTVYDLAGSAADDVWAVGSAIGARHEIVHWDGRTWSVSSYADEANASITSVWASARDDAWIVGSDTILHWDGTAWADAGQEAARGAVLCVRHPMGCD